MKSHSFDVSFAFCYTSGREHDLRVTGSISDYVPAPGPSMANAGGDPAEGGEIEDLTIFLVRKNKERDVPDKSGKLAEALEDTVMERATKDADDGGPDWDAINDARWEARQGM